MRKELAAHRKRGQNRDWRKTWIFPPATYFRKPWAFHMGFSSVLLHTVLQSDLRLVIPTFRSRCDLSCSAQARVQQLLQMQNLHKRLWKTRRRILWKRIRQERKCWKQVGANSFYLFSSFSSSNNNPIFLAFGGFFICDILPPMNRCGLLASMLTLLGQTLQACFPHALRYDSKCW